MSLPPPSGRSWLRRSRAVPAPGSRLPARPARFAPVHSLRARAGPSRGAVLSAPRRARREGAASAAQPARLRRAVPGSRPPTPHPQLPALPGGLQTGAATLAPTAPAPPSRPQASTDLAVPATVRATAGLRRVQRGGPFCSSSSRRRLVQLRRASRGCGCCRRRPPITPLSQALTCYRSPSRWEIQISLSLPRSLPSPSLLLPPSLPIPSSSLTPLARSLPLALPFSLSISLCWCVRV